MATSPQGDDQTLRRAVVRNLARRIAQQRQGAGTNMPLTPRTPRRLAARPMPLRQGTPVR